MIDLMVLEMKKFKLYRYIKSILITMVVLTALNMLMLYTSKQNNEMMFENFDTAFVFFGVLIRGTFIVFSSILLAKLTVDEYKTKTIQLMYSYPISRKKLMAAKLCSVYLFTVITIIISSIITIPILGAFCATTQALPDNLTAGLFVSKMPDVVFGAVLSGFIALIPFYFGMRKKSTAATIITACILAMFLTSSAGSASGQYYMIRLLVIGGLSILFVAATLGRKINMVQEEEV